MAHESRLVKPAEPGIAEPAIETAPPLASVTFAPRQYPEQTIIEGNPKVGTIVFLAQRHYTPEIARDTARLKEIGLVQAHILCELGRRNLTILFCEGFTQNLLHGDSPQDGRPSREEIRTLFPVSPFDWQKATEAQLQFLARRGASTVWWGMRSDVDVLATSTEAFEKDVWSRMENQSLPISVREKAKMLEREQKTVECINKFLASNPGATVGLIYGHGHKFSAEHFPAGCSDSLPSLIRIQVPGATFETGLYSQLKVPVSPKRQRQLIAEASGVRTFELSSITDPEALEAAYEKVKVDLVRDTASQLLERIRWIIKDLSLLGSEFEQKVEADFSNKQGPFANLFPRADVPWAKVPAMSCSQVSKLIIDELHGPTQRELVALAVGITEEAFRNLCSSDLQIKALGKLRLGNWLMNGMANSEVLEKLLKLGCLDDNCRDALSNSFPQLSRQLTDVTVPKVILDRLHQFTAEEVGQVLFDNQNMPSQKAVISKVCEIPAEAIKFIPSLELRLEALPKLKFAADSSPNERRSFLLSFDNSKPFTEAVEALMKRRQGPFHYPWRFWFQ